MSRSLAPENVLPRLHGRFGREYVYAERCASTQRMLAADAREGAVAVAEEQTEGRGRLGRRWLDVPRRSILCSIALAPPVAPALLPELSLVAGTAVAEAIEAVTGLVPDLKFPNDVLVGGRKVCGILAEAREGRVVLGIGINVNMTPAELPREVEMPPTSLRAETGAEVDRAELLAAVLECLEERYDEWVAGART